MAASTDDRVSHDNRFTEIDAIRELFDAVAAGDRLRAERVALPHVVDEVQGFYDGGTTMAVPERCNFEVTGGSRACMIRASSGEAFILTVAVAPDGRWRVESYEYLGGGM